MKVLFSSPSVVVVDDFLDPSSLARVWAYVQMESYELVHGPEWYKTYRLLDGMALEGPTYLSTCISADPSHSYPTGRAIDEIISHIDRCAPAFQEQIGVRGEDWRVFTARVFLYRAGSGLSWHTDVDRELPRVGAYVFYAHPVWRSTWGGELLVADGDGPSGAPSWLGAVDDVDGLSAGRYFMPRPNRLIVLRSGCWHAIRAVHPAAGEHVRASIAGFFLQ